MTASPRTAPAGPRTPLTHDGVLEAAVALADRAGLAGLTMRSLAADLGVEAMSLYHHVPNKDAVLAGAVDQVVDEINRAVAALDLSRPTRDWRADLRATILAARDVLLAHPWAPELIETRASLSLPVIEHHETVLRLMREGGFTWDLAHHALHALGSRALGFTQELFQPDDATSDEELTNQLMAAADRFPSLVSMLTEISHDPDDPTLGWCDDQTEFEFALDLLLDGLERLRMAEAAP